MKRFHVNLAVADLGASIRFYTGLFGMEPTVRKPDYAKWMLEDPRVNFALSARGRAPGVDHLGIQVEDEEELREVYSRLSESGGPVLEEGKTTCCYAKSEKSWVTDPQGVAWETFLTTGEATVYGGDSSLGSGEARIAAAVPADRPGGTCCGPAAAAE